MMDFQKERQALIAQAQQLQTQLTQAQQTVEAVRTELAKVIGKLEQLAEWERRQAAVVDGHELSHKD